MKVHRLKTWPGPFDDVKGGWKPFEIRKDDRDYSVGDYLVLDRYNNLLGEYDEHEKPLVRKVTYILRGGRFGVAESHVVMAIAPAPVAIDLKEVILSLAPAIERTVLPSGDKQEKKSG